MNLFLKRVIAYILDFFVVSAFMWIFSYLAYFGINYYNMFSIYNYLIWILPIVTILYFTILEKNIGATVGKRLMFIEVRSTRQARAIRRTRAPLTYTQALIRSISKVYWFPIIIDVVLGKISGNTRILDKISRTVVLNENATGFEIRQSRKGYY